jgi:deoxyribodipyrimidine photo-lyase
MKRTIVWFRRDLRAADHEPLFQAASRGAVIPIFVLDPALLHHPETAAIRVAFMLDCLRSLDQDLRALGGRLILRSGNPIEILPQLVHETAADGIYAYLDYERIYGRVRDGRLNQTLEKRKFKIRWFEPVAGTGDLMVYPDYRDFWFAEMSADQVLTPKQLLVPDNIPSEPFPDLMSLAIAADDKPMPTGGTQAARQLLQEFFSEKADRYYWQLSYPSAEASTGLSPYIKFGVISIRECYQTALRYKQSSDLRVKRSCQQFIDRLRWGSGFAQRFRYLPQLELRSLYEVFDVEGWKFDEVAYQAWQNGQTGFPIVDAAARCLQATGGWKALNFRVRAIYASFLSNLLGIDWRYGALHFMRHLIDGDCPIDHYQWAMQSGVTHCIDKNWTRIYNPEQVAIDRCDPEGHFIKRWVPELAHLPPEMLGSPLFSQNYPAPILNYKIARQQRVQQLSQQRQVFLNQDNVLPYLARLPEVLTPFGSDRYKSNILWTQNSTHDLFPTFLDLDGLDAEQAAALRTWFVAHVNFPPRKRSSRTSQPKQDTNAIQLSLLD